MEGISIHPGVPRVILFHIVVRIPSVPILLAESTMIKLHEPDSTLHQTAGHDALPAERLGDLLVQPVELARGFRTTSPQGDLGPQGRESDQFPSAP